MAKVFFKQFDIRPDHILKLNSATPAERIGEIIMGLTAEFKKNRPDLVLTVGDVDSTLAASIAANKTGILQGHIESGLRSFDLSMPEEFNRKITDQISDFHFITERQALNNLKQENIGIKNTFFSGNTMIDTLIAFQDEIDKSDILTENKLSTRQYIVGTFHRPSNVDSASNLEQITEIIQKIAEKISIVIPLHPRTIAKLKEYNLVQKLNSEKIIITGPLDYFRFQKLIKNAKGIVTDSGGIQEETTYYKVPCITVRENTERPITVTVGSNELCKDLHSEEFNHLLNKLLNDQWKESNIPEYWDGKSTFRILEYLKNAM
jgi:UDP-N-acetylglucosamine 2-epimerase (non-hydrolysing)